MMAVVGSDAAFDRDREQLELLAGLQVSTKSVERQSERIGAEIMRLEQLDGQPAHTREVKQCAFKFLRRGLCVHLDRCGQG